MNNKKSTYKDNICAVSDFKELSRIRGFVSSKAKIFGFTDNDAQKIALAVDEACSNLIRHAYNFNISRKIYVEIETFKKEFHVRISDVGAPFNPLNVAEQDMRKYLKEYRRGGLGIQIMRKVMDKISYYPSDNSNPKNVLMLTKVLN